MLDMLHMLDEAKCFSYIYKDSWHITGYETK
jgi:hypothetical protein